MTTSRRRLLSPVVVLLAALALAHDAWPCTDALASADDPVVTRAHDVAAMIGGEAKVPDGVYDAAFLKAVPPAQLLGIMQNLATLGEVTELVRTGFASSLEGVFEIHFSSGQVLPMTLTVGADTRHLVVGLFFGAPETEIADLDGVLAKLGELHGRVGFAAARLGDHGCEWIARRESETTLALGSSFKLYVLGELAAQIAAGRRAWTDVVPLREEWMSVPSGTLQDWPAGSPLTLHSLATFMISISDNTATDHLLHTLGRKAVEARVAEMGHATPARMRPFLSTGEMFRIKFAPGEEEARAWLRLDEAKRRTWLDEVCPELPISGEGTDPAALARPKLVDEVEWFASAEDLCRAMDALRRAGEHDPMLLPVLAVNPGIPAAKGSFDYVGYKGGSETGVLSMAFLLRKGKTWYALAVVWNDPAAEVDTGELVGIVSGALRLVAKS
ncbi:MAG: serine hydrolase [Planctomycetes bacterium]|nr:serine hydrolase [Planctomycetota bacterium]